MHVNRGGVPVADTYNHVRMYNKPGQGHTESRSHVHHITVNMEQCNSDVDVSTVTAIR